MKRIHKKILNEISKYLEKYPDIRFGQALMNLEINVIDEWKQTRYILRDIYNDSDESILARMEERIRLFKNMAKPYKNVKSEYKLRKNHKYISEKID